MSDGFRWRVLVQVVSAPEACTPRPYRHTPTLPRPRWEREATPTGSRWRVLVQVVSEPEACAPRRCRCLLSAPEACAPRRCRCLLSAPEARAPSPYRHAPTLPRPRWEREATPAGSRWRVLVLVASAPEARAPRGCRCLLLRGVP